MIKLQFLESEIVQLNTNSTSKSNVKSKETELVVEDKTNVTNVILNVVGVRNP